MIVNIRKHVMTSKVLFPSLSSLSWTNSPTIVADALMAHFMVAEFSQSYIYRGRVSSLPYVAQNNQNNLQAYATELQSTLETYFSRYFNSVVVDTNVITDPENSDQEAVNLYLEYTDTVGNKHTLSKLASFVDGKFSELTTLNNGT